VGALLSFALLVLADLQRTNRVLLEETLERLKEVQYGTTTGPAPTDARGNRAESAERAADVAAAPGRPAGSGLADVPAAV
jgi:hypothetical protein